MLTKHRLAEYLIRAIEVTTPEGEYAARYPHHPAEMILDGTFNFEDIADFLLAEYIGGGEF